MSKAQTQELSQWLSSMGVVDQFSNQDIESGRTVASLLTAINRDNKIQLQDGNSAINRVTNWTNIIQYLKTINIKITQEEKSKIINGNHDLVFKVISKLRESHHKSSKQTEINIKDIDLKKDVKESDSLLELFLLSIVKNFGLSSKEALSLLSNDSKYLAHILAKGLKGDFRPIQSFIADLLRMLPKIAIFSKNKQNQQFFLRSIKPALISKSQTVAQSTLFLMKSYLQGYSKQTRNSLLRQHLLPTLILIIRRHPQLIDKVVATAIQLSQFSDDILTQLIANTPKNDLNNIFLSLWKIYYEHQHEQLLIKATSFQKLVQNTTATLKQAQFVLGSLDVMIEIAGNNFDIFSRKFAESLIASFRDIVITKDCQNIVFIHSSCSLLKLAGEAKHPLAPLIFKTLTSKLTSATNGQYDCLITNLMQIITEIPTIPALPILEALTQKSEIKVSQTELQLFNRIMSVGTEAKSGVVIYNIASRSLVEEVGLGYQMSNLLSGIISVFHEQQIILDMTVKLIKVCLAIHYANVKKLSGKRKPISHKSQLEGEQATAKLKILQIQHFIRLVVKANQKQIINNIEPLLCFSYMQIVAINKQLAKGLERIIQLLGDVNQLTAKYELELQDAQHNNSSIKQSKVKPTQIQRYQEERTNQSQDLPKTGRRVNSSHPMSLSLAGVKPDAYLGLQKYSKLHQTKFLAELAKKQIVTQKQQNTIKLKKVYEKKMMLQKGLFIRSVSENELQYLFEFDSKEIYAQTNLLHLNFYTNQCEEESDARSLQNLMKKYEKALRVYFTIYSGKKSYITVKYFDDYSDRNNFIHSSLILKMIKDHGLQNFITPREVQLLARKVNYKLAKSRDDPESLDFQAFKQFMMQMCYTMYTRPPKDLSGHPVAEMIQELFSNLKIYAGENRISQTIFEQPQACFTNQEQAVKVLNKKLQQNPDYILPEGYKKITQTKVSYDYKIYLQALSLTYKDVYEVIDEMLYDAFKFHIIQPFIQEEKQSKARPNIYHLERAKIQQIDTKHLPIYLKKEVAKYPILDRLIAKEAASALSEIIQAVQFNHEQIGLKHENPLVKSRYEKQQEERRIRELNDKKRLTFDRQIKSSMEENKEKRQEKREAEETVKKEELEKKKLNKERKEKREKELKDKLEEYAQKKKEEEENKKSQELGRQQREKDQVEKKKKQFQETKRKIEELKEQKKKEEKERKQKEKEEQRLKKIEQKQKFQKTQKQKKLKLQQYKQRKKGGVQATQSKVLDGQNSS